ncbi:hypothetical protein [Clostridium sp. D53t1_180928_C8]|uniref:hypothetical protein n=1 Tax=Clostridium sp. D53t1_180928_C8 TaxID=2787101 RepID=UPI0018ABD9BF|nr:hypothetical protein [Clostridium sp. D53t1_180928_C8]
MKRFLSCLLSILTLLSIILYTLPVSASSIENPYSQFVDDPYYEVTSDFITGITDKLSKLPASGSVCIDYLGEEILLHRAILFATNNIESYSNNPELIDISDDIIDNYTGELKEMRIELGRLIDTYGKNKESLKEDDDYIKQYKVIVDKLIKDLSEIKESESNEKTYIKQAIALLQASHDISSMNTKCAKSELVKEIAKDEITNTQEYISRLKTLETALK